MSSNQLTLPKIHLNKTLKKLGLQNEIDLLHYYPRTHITYTRTPINQIKQNDTVTIIGVVIKHTITQSTDTRLTIQKWQIKERSGTINCTRFHNHHYYRSQQWQNQQQQIYLYGTVVCVTGKTRYNDFSQQLEINNPTIIIIDKQTAQQTSSKIVPVYPLTKGVTNESLRQIINDLLDECCIEDPLPEQIRQQFKLETLEKALINIHLPRNVKELQTARQRLVFDEFFYLTVKIQQRRNQIKSTSSP